MEGTLTDRERVGLAHEARCLACRLAPQRGADGARYRVDRPELRERLERCLHELAADAIERDIRRVQQGI